MRVRAGGAWARGGFGLLGMEERAASVGAEFSLAMPRPTAGHPGGGGVPVSSPVSVLLADDHPPGPAAMVRQALERGGDFHVCVEASDATSAVQGAKEAHPDVCLLDINMPGNGIAAAAQITGALPHTAVVMLTVSRDRTRTSSTRCGRGIRLPAEGDGRGLHRRRAPACAGRGGQRCPGPWWPASWTSSATGSSAGSPCPTHRRPASPVAQWDVLELMRKGASTAEISGRLFVSPTTVRSHVSAILRKLGVGRRGRLAIKLLDGG